MREVFLETVHPWKDKYVLRLTEKDGARSVPLWVGERDVREVNRVLTSGPEHRAQPHDLMLEAISRLGGKVLQVAITEFRDDTYYAKLVLEQGGRRLEVDARPSDAVNVALRAHVPIFADATLLRRYRRPADPNTDDRNAKGGTAQPTE